MSEKPRTDKRRGAPRELYLIVFLSFLGVLVGRAADSFPEFDFRQASVVAGWVSDHDVGALEAGAEGMVIRITGSDPYLHGPARDYPEAKPLWMEVTLNSEAGGSAQIFYFRDHPAEAQSVRFQVPAGRVHRVRLPLPALGSGGRLRFDPPGDSGGCVLQSIRFEERRSFSAPAWPKREAVALSSEALVLRVPGLELRHDPQRFSTFQLWVEDRLFACSLNRPLLGYLERGVVRWMELGAGESALVETVANETHVEVVLTQRDEEGGTWRWRRRFAADPAGYVRFEEEVSVDRDCAVVYLPSLSLVAGLGSFGTNKQGALFPGLEYLANEPSSSEADIRGVGAARQVPDSVKITIPLMALQAEGRQLGMIWTPDRDLAAAFDSPDRLYGEAGHLMQLLRPGSDGKNREAAALLPYFPLELEANQPLFTEAILFGGRSRDIATAVQSYVRWRGLPSLPHSGYDATAYFRLAAHGWLDSRIRESALYRHAYWPGFGAQPAGDAALWQEWLSTRVADPDLQARLVTAAKEALAVVPPERYLDTAVGHVRYPAVPLAYGEVAKAVGRARQIAREQLGRFSGPGQVVYHPAAGKPDYGSTHWSREANGLVAPVVASLLENAAFAGDTNLIAAGLVHLRALEAFRGSVPRGAQTWEIPLHTPDILASAHLVRAFVLGYALTGDRELLDQAIEWAWTGVPFLYLQPPTDGSVGLYNTIAVLGATSWQAPSWFGQPVQWCGLVYADALNWLRPYDPEGPWKTLADGIAIGGVQHTWPQEDAERQGLLPDFFLLRIQERDGPAINPATVLAPAVSLYGETPVYDFRAVPTRGYLIHAPGRIGGMKTTQAGFEFSVTPWTERTVEVLMHGVGSTENIGSKRAERESFEAANVEELTGEARGSVVVAIEGKTWIQVAPTETPRSSDQRSMSEHQRFNHSPGEP